MFKLIAYAESTSTGAAGYNRAVSRQLQNATGVSARAANRTIRGNANGRAPFAPQRGRNASPANVRRNAGL